MSWKIVAAVLLLTTSLTTASLPVHANDAPADDNDPPEVDAGLDQRVYAGTTVLLDAGGTRDPDGRITSYEWRIETPNGTTTTPNCPACERTRFRATEPGRYAVTLTATDDDGATRSDTLYVTARADDGPSVTLDGPRTTTPGSTVEYEAIPTAGTEPLSTVKWSINGTRTPNRNSTTLTTTVTEPGTRTITVTVTDAIGRTATADTLLTVPSDDDEPNDDNDSEPNDPTPPDNPSEPIFEPGEETPENDTNTSNDADPRTNDTTQITLADRYEPTVNGPRIVTGNEPLIARYELATDAPARNITRVQWIANDERVAKSRSLRATWTPGDHTLYAKVTYRDGTSETARFPDQTTIVTADPAPETRLPVPSLDDDLSGSFRATDGYDNLRHVTVTVNDRTVFDGNYPSIRYRGPETITDTYQFADLEPDTRYTVEVTATDTRGQTSTSTRTIRTGNDSRTTEPEIISAGFVQDTVDSYHPRIKPERYTAEHVIKIDLNGYPASEVEFDPQGRNIRLRQLSKTSRNYIPSSDTLIIRSNWAGEQPDKYGLDGELHFNHSVVAIEKNYFQVTPSPPELRLTSPTQGTERRVEDWGMVVDASESFDPDGTQIEINWLHGATSVKGRPGVAKLDPYERAGVRIIDGSDATAEELGSFLKYYLPRVQEPVEVTEGPYNGSDFVTLELRTEPYAFTKSESRYNITVGARSASSAVRVQSVSKVDVEPSTKSNQNEVKHRRHQWVIRVKVRASSLNESQNWVTIYNAEKPESIFVEKELGDVNLRFESEKRDLEVSDRRYAVINRNGTERREVIEASTAQRLLGQGWRIAGKRQVVDGVVIESLEEQRVSEVRTKRFDTASDARGYVRTHEGWRYERVESSEETRIDVVTKWVRTLNVGRPTGATRRVVTNPDAVVKQRRYRYKDTETVEQQRKVIVEKQKTVTRQRTRKRTVCSPTDGCKTVEEQVSYETTIDVEKAVRKTVTVKRDVWKYYWANSPRMPSHKSTSSTRVIRTEPKQYATEYQVQVPVEKTVTERTHIVSGEVTMLRETWQYSSKVASMQRARSIVSNPTKRIGEVRQHTVWILAKNKTVTEVRHTYDDKGNVETTYATVTGVLEYAPNDTRTFEITVEISGFATETEIIEVAMNRSMTCGNDEEECYA